MNIFIISMLIGSFSSIYTAAQERNTGRELVTSLYIRNNETEARELINNGADVNYRFDQGWTPLHAAARYGFEEIVQMLVERHADIEYKNEVNDTPLHLAAVGDHVKVIQILADYGAKLNERNFQYETPLHLAAKTNREHAVKLLLELGAVQVRNDFGKEPRDLAFEKGFPKIVQLLDKAAVRYRNIHRACQNYSVEAPDDFILEGFLVKPGEFPWMAALGYLNTTYGVTFRCGGTIISDRFILTAAHCLTREPPLVVVRLGENKLSDKDGKDFYIEEMIKHPNYSTATKKNDIALLRLTRRIIFAPNIRPACLEMELRDHLRHVELNVTGWGTTSAELNTGSNELRKAQVKTVLLSECNKTYWRYNLEANVDEFKDGLTKGQYCASDPSGRMDSCKGDSGGPLQYYPNGAYTARVVGIVSFGVSCGTLPGIYTRVAFYLDWIQSNVWPNSDTLLSY